MNSMTMYITKQNKKISFLDVNVKEPVPKFLHQVWFTSFSANYAVNPTTENFLDILM